MKLVKIYLRGGQIIEKVTDDWSLEKSRVSGDLLSMKWTEQSDDRMPYVRAESVDAITVHNFVQEETPE